MTCNVIPRLDLPGLFKQLLKIWSKEKQQLPRKSVCVGTFVGICHVQIYLIFFIDRHLLRAYLPYILLKIV